MESGEEVNGEDTDLLEDHLPDRKRRLTSFRAKQITFNPNDVIDEQGICRQKADEVCHNNSQKNRSKLFFAIQLS